MATGPSSVPCCTLSPRIVSAQSLSAVEAGGPVPATPASGGRPARSPRGPACLQLFCGCAKVLRGEGEAVEAGVVGVLVFDVDSHVRVDPGECGEELGPVGDVVPDTHRDELPAGVVRPGVDTEAVAGGHLARVVGGTRWNEVSSTPRCRPR